MLRWKLRDAATVHPNGVQRVVRKARSFARRRSYAVHESGNQRREWCECGKPKTESYDARSAVSGIEFRAVRSVALKI